MQELMNSSFVARLLEGSKMLISMQVNGNYSYEVKNHFGTNYAMVGDARGLSIPFFPAGFSFPSRALPLLLPPSTDN